jgi:hypothetical protein
MKRSLLLLLVVIGACTQPSGKDPVAGTPVVITNDTIPETRSSVKPGPIAEYSERVPDELNDWKFSVAAYETGRTFHFLLRMQYKELRVNDSLHIPNFGIQPKLELHKGKEPFTCIIGFLDKKGQFKEYKKAAVLHDKLKISTINNYYVGSYRTKVKTP